MFPIFREYDNLLSDHDISELYKKSKYDPTETLNDAQIYVNETKKNTLDPDIRHCKEMMLSDELHPWLDKKITNKLNKGIEHLGVRFEIHNAVSRIIRYEEGGRRKEEGGMFKRHQDVIDVASNLFRNYSLLINLEPCEKGGETVLYSENNNDNDDIVMESAHISEHTSRIRGGGLIFPKHLDHEGMPIIKGAKTILFVNYLCYKLEQDYLIVCTQPDNERFILPAKILNDIKEKGLLHEFYELSKKQNPDQKVFHFETDIITTNEFKIIHKDMFGQSDYDFDDFDKLKIKIDYLCYKLHDYDHVRDDQMNIEILTEEDMKIFKSILARKTDKINANNRIQSFKCKIISVQDFIFIDYLYLNNKLVFSDPCTKYSPSVEWKKVPDSGICIVDSDMSYGYCYNFEKPGSECIIGTFVHKKYDSGLCFRCASKLYNSLNDGKKKLTKDEESFIAYFRKSEEDNIGMALTNDQDFALEIFEDDEKNYYGGVRHRQIKYPAYSLESLEKHRKDKKAINFALCMNQSKGGIIDEKTMDIPHIIYDMIRACKNTSISSGKTASWGGKYNQEVIHEMAIREGYIDLSKYTFGSKDYAPY